jgi:hypothetical protein
VPKLGQEHSLTSDGESHCSGVLAKKAAKSVENKGFSDFCVGRRAPM